MYREIIVRPQCVSLEGMLSRVALINRIGMFYFVAYDVDLTDYDFSFLEKDDLKWHIKGKYQLSPTNIKTDTFQDMVKECCVEDQLLGITSDVTLVGGIKKNLFILDFDCPCSDKNLGKIIDYLVHQNLDHGFILESGRSYHFYSKQLVDRAIWTKLLTEVQEFDLVGRAWPHLQLVRGYSILRLSSSKHKPEIPKVIMELGVEELEKGQTYFPFYEQDS